MKTINQTQQEIYNQIEEIVKQSMNNSKLKTNLNKKELLRVLMEECRAFKDAERQNAISRIKNCKNKQESTKRTFFSDGGFKDTIQSYPCFNQSFEDKCLACQRDIEFYELKESDLK